ncbi:unnamed protein product [Didymodactylos carnosus]|uniref:Chromo domain-containing protein n=1 Tax=Didymodactylos carnosus TaxID=1234261 RepID=A0A814AKN9_9BILA|nr:unnamed protein product [Didymodactylos carnosus]CAF1375189.1 unnamed protein product [Didymodactylos carnosus]CAF3695822.1 unnamed protein product [Didymodactylos carnosus]CAF4184120.1 unnamed protein product [Didymodactylos carnosus]
MVDNKKNKKTEEKSSGKVYAAEKLLRRRRYKGKTEYLVKWKGWKTRHNTWEPEVNIIDKRLIEHFKKHPLPCRSRKVLEVVSSEEEEDNTTNEEPICNIKLENKTDLLPRNITAETLENNHNNEDASKDLKSMSVIQEPIEFWYPKSVEQKFAITDVICNDVTVTIREYVNRI